MDCIGFVWSQRVYVEIHRVEDIFGDNTCTYLICGYPGLWAGGLSYRMIETQPNTYTHKMLPRDSYNNIDTADSTGQVLDAHR